MPVVNTTPLHISKINNNDDECGESLIFKQNQIKCFDSYKFNDDDQEHVF
jgi:hypothetical protein